MTVCQYTPEWISAPAEAGGVPASHRWALPRVVTLKTAKEGALAAYLVMSFVYYLRGGPLGHLANVVFLALFAALATAGKERIRLAGWPLAVMLVCTYLMLASLVGAAARQPFEPTDLARALTWLLPIGMLLVLSHEPVPDFCRVGLVAGSIGLCVNLLVTLTLGTFDPGKAKLEISTGLLDVSSNELSFHWVVFGAGLLLLARGYARKVGLFLLLVSLLHLSKAHLASLVVAAWAALLRGRWLVSMVLAGIACWLLYAAVVSGALERVAIADALVPAFGRLRDMLVVLGAAVLDQSIPLAALGKAIGGARYDVYDAAWSLIVQNPFGYGATEVDRGLNGLDPHSNLVYLALREGWAVLAGYLLAIVLGLRAISPSGDSGRLLLALAFYLVLRTFFMTYDPVRVVVMLVFFAHCAMAAAPRIAEGSSRRTGMQPSAAGAAS